MFIDHSMINILEELINISYGYKSSPMSLPGIRRLV